MNIAHRISASTILKIIICMLLFAEAMQPAVDPDLGWHLRYGEYFWQTGHVLRDNTLSYIWPTYKWVQASWGYDVIIYQLFSHFGFLGLELTAATLTLLTFLILTYPQRRFAVIQFLFLALTFFAMIAPMWGPGMRTSTLSTPFMAIAIVLSDILLFPEERKRSDILFAALPLLFFIWANLHGGFALGLILLTIQWLGAILVRSVDRKTALTFGAALTLSYVTPLINPWGIRIYEETFKHSTNVNLNMITEWMPLTFLTVESFVTAALLLITISVVIYKRRWKAFPSVAILLVAAYLAYSANRFLVVVAVIMTYLLARDIGAVHPAITRRRWMRIAAAIFLISLYPLDMFVFKRYFPPPSENPLTYSWPDYCRVTHGCSEAITEIMRANPPKGHGYHPYNYGGYLIWRVPEVQTFIDGRMAAWEQNGVPPPVLAESDWAFMQNGPIAFTKFDNQYHFAWAIVPTDSGITNYLDDLEKNHQWERKYRDTNYSYYVRLTR